jgi:hypothetical protein
MPITLNGTTGITSPAIDLTTPLPAVDGGTGLTSAGTSGNVLTSDGTNWTSSVAPTPAALSTASGSAPSYSARAWVSFNGTGTVAIRGSGNVSSITDNGTGDYTVNFTTAMADTNYSFVTGGMYADVSDGGAGAQAFNARQDFPPTTTSLRGIWKQGNTSGGRDTLFCCVAIFR